MAIRNFAKYWLVALLATACTVEETLENPQAPETTEPAVSEEEYYVPGTAVVEFNEELTSIIEAGAVQTKSQGLAELMESMGITSMERVFPHAGKYEGRTRRAGLHRFYTVEFSEKTPVTKAMSGLSDIPGVVSVTPSRPIEKRAVFNDPKLSSQWHYINTKYSNADINVKEVWENYTTGSSSVIVCVVDEPIDATHEDLKDNLWTDGQGHTGYNYAKSSYDLSIDPANGSGDVGHGTHVSGTIAAVNNNAIGVCGIAGGNHENGVSGVRLMSHAIFSGKKTASDAGFAKAIKDAADKGAVISNNSWGPSYNVSTSYKLDSYDPDCAAAIRYFIQYAGCDDDGNQLPDSPMKGGLVFFAAGNNSYKWDPYAGYEYVYGVGAFGYTGGRASYSNYGDWVDIAAPGGDYDGYVWSTVPSKVANDYGTGVKTTDGYDGDGWGGTSMACPHASGVAALIVSYFGQPGFTREDAMRIIEGGLGSVIGGSKPIGKKIDVLSSFEWAFANGYTAGTAVTPQENVAPVITLSNDSVSLSYKGTETVQVSIKDANRDELDITCSPGSPALKFDKAAGTATITASLAPAGTYTAVFKAVETSTEEKYSTTATLTYTINPNQAPVIVLGDKVLSVPQSVSRKTTLSISEPDNDSFTVDITPGSEALTYDGAKGEITIVGKKADIGNYFAVISATDEAGLTARDTLHYAITPNNPPVVNLGSYKFDNMLLGSLNLNLQISKPENIEDLFYDPDGETLSVKVENSNSSVAVIRDKGDKFNVTSLSYGISEITISATDGMGAKTAISFSIAVKDGSKSSVAEAIPEVAVDKVNLWSSNATIETLNVKIYSSLGAKVMDFSAEGGLYKLITVDITGLAPGVYSAVITGSSIKGTAKFIKI